MIQLVHCWSSLSHNSAFFRKCLSLCLNKIRVNQSLSCLFFRLKYLISSLQMGLEANRQLRRWRYSSGMWHNERKQQTKGVLSSQLLLWGMSLRPTGSALGVSVKPIPQTYSTQRALKLICLYANSYQSFPGTAHGEVCSFPGTFGCYASGKAKSKTQKKLSGKVIKVLAFGNPVSIPEVGMERGNGQGTNNICYTVSKQDITKSIRGSCECPLFWHEDCCWWKKIGKAG